MSKRFVLFLILSIASMLSSAQSDAARLLIAAPPGGGTDTVFRILAKEAGAVLERHIVPINLPAAQGIVAVEQLIAAAPDGKTLAGVPNSSITATPHVLKVPFGPDDYVPVLGISNSPYALCVAPSFAANTGAELIAELKRRPGHYTIGTDGGSGLLASSRVLQSLGADARYIPFKGASEILVAFLGGHIDVYSGSVPAILPSANAKKAKCLLLTTAARSSVLPQASGLRDLGIPDQETPLWWVLLAPKLTPRETLDRIREASMKAAGSPAMQKFLVETGNPVTVFTGDELSARLKKEYAGLAATSQKLGLTPK